MNSFESVMSQFSSFLHAAPPSFKEFLEGISEESRALREEEEEEELKKTNNDYFMGD